jgi:hypothetical protein
LLALLLALGAPQLAACESNAAAAAAEPSAAAAPAAVAPDTAATPPSRDTATASAAAAAAEASREPSVAARPAPARAAAVTPDGVAPPSTGRFGAPSGARSASATTAVTVRRLVVAHDVVEREPVVREGAFAGGQDRVFAFVEARNLDAAEGAIRIYFDGPDGQRVGDIGLEVPGAQRRWRTWGYSRNVSAPGTWEAVVVDASGAVLAREAFEVR